MLDTLPASSLVWIGCANALLATALALVALAGSRLVKNPAVAHWLWLVVLLKLVTPPLLQLDVSLPLGPDAPVSSVREGIVIPDGPPVEPGEGDLDGGLDGDAHPASALEVAAIPMEEPSEPFDWKAFSRPLDDAMPPVPSRIMEAGGEAPPAVLPSRESPAAAPSSWTVDPVLLAALFWALGSAAWLLVAAVRIARFARLIRRAKPAPPELASEVARVAARIGLRRPPATVVVGARIAPLVWAPGARARLVLPAELLDSLTGNQRRTLIAHELAHLRRRDHWVRSLEIAATALYWWCPLLWWARRELHRTEEACCDAWVESTYPGSSREYAGTLLSAVDFLSENPAALPEGASAMRHVTRLKRRLEMILEGPRNHRISGVARSGLVAFAAAVLPWAPGPGAQDAPPKAPEAPGTHEPPRPLPPAQPVEAPRPPEPGATPAPRVPGADSSMRGVRPEDVHEQVQAIRRELRRLQRQLEALGARLEEPAERPKSLRAGPVRSGGRTSATAPRGDDRPLGLFPDPDHPRAGAPAKPSSDDAGRRLYRVDPGARTIVPAAPAAPSELRAQNLRARIAEATGPQLDVVQLASALLEAKGARRLAEHKVASLQATVEGQIVPSRQELETAKIELELAASKLSLLERMARSALKGVKGELEGLIRMKEAVETQYRSGTSSLVDAAGLDVRIARVRMFLELLEEILRESAPRGGLKP